MGHRNSTAVHTQMGNDLGSHFDAHRHRRESVDLVAMSAECSELMAEIEKTAKEVGGDSKKSLRYREAKEIKSVIRKLEQLGNGYYTYTEAGDDALAKGV